MFRMNLSCILKRFENLSSRLSMLIFMCIRCLGIHPVFLRLKLLEELAIILLLVIRLRSITIHTFSTTIVSPLVLHLLLSTRVEVFYSDVLLLRLSFATRIKYVYCLMYVLLFLILDLAHIKLVHG